MFTRDMKCEACGYEGKVTAHDTIGKVAESDLFQILGKDSSTGLLHFLCPRCHADIAVDPFKAVVAKRMVGYPDTVASRPGRSWRVIWFVVLAVGIMVVVAKCGLI